MIAHGRMGNSVPFFLMISQDIGYLWDRRAGADPFSLPTIEFPMASVVSFYLPWLEGGRRLGGQALELAVAQWLTDLANGRSDRPRDVERYLDESGFVAAVQGARVNTDSAR